MMAAGKAAESGARVIVLEKMKKPGMKLRITGKGRCNITNIAGLTEFMAHFGKNGKFLRNAFSQFFNTELLDFFQNLGLQVVTERGGRVFPVSGKATEVVEILLKWNQQLGVEIRTNASVDSISTENQQIVGVYSTGNLIQCDAVILAAGGSSYPLTGSTGDGCLLAEKTGHRITALRPSLVPLETEGGFSGKIEGLNLRNIQVNLFLDGKKKSEAFGELVFADYGVTGPVILTLSQQIVDALAENRQVELALDLKPALDDKKLEGRLIRDLEKRGKESLESILRGLLPADMIPLCLKLTGLNGELTGSQVSAKNRKKLKTWLKDFRISVIGHRPMDEAIVTAGGVSLKEMNPATMESKLIQGLYVAGEVLDIQADTGGYNLQAAFSTGWLAGKAASESA